MPSLRISDALWYTVLARTIRPVAIGHPLHASCKLVARGHAILAHFRCTMVHNVWRLLMVQHNRLVPAPIGAFGERVAALAKVLTHSWAHTCIM